MTTTSGTASSSAVRALALEYKSLEEDPLEGIRPKLPDENNLFEWEVALFGPPDTLYQGGYFKALVKFPSDYPYSPPTVRFISKVWHPNVYEGWRQDLCNLVSVGKSSVFLQGQFIIWEDSPNRREENGDLCISILHPPVDDPQSGELPCERWNPTQNVRTILLSVVSLLNEPNTYSPANVDASVMFRRWKESKGKDKEYENIIRKQVQASRAEAEKDGVVVPTTMEEYCLKPKPRPSNPDNVDIDDLYDDEDCYIDDDDEYEDYDEDGSDEEDEAGSDDSGNAES